MSKLISTLLFSLAASGASAQAPRVVADIAPVHSLAAQIMQGVGEPFLLVEPTASPHSYALRPSQAVHLEKADVVLLTSSDLTPWLVPVLESLASDALLFELMEIDGVVQLASRGEHEDEGEAEEHVDHDDHDDHKEEAHDDHDHGAEDHEEDEKRRKMLRLWLKMPNARSASDEFPGRNGFPVPASVFA